MKNNSDKKIQKEKKTVTEAKTTQFSETNISISNPIYLNISHI